MGLVRELLFIVSTSIHLDCNMGPFIFMLNLCAIRDFYMIASFFILTMMFNALLDAINFVQLVDLPLLNG